MHPLSYDSQRFAIQTKVLEKQCFDSAIAKAEQLVQSGTSLRVYMMSGRICQEAFESFQREIQTAFPSKDYNNLIVLTLKSRENLFFLDLKNRVIHILRDQDQDDLIKEN